MIQYKTNSPSISFLTSHCCPAQCLKLESNTKAFCNSVQTIDI